MKKDINTIVFAARRPKPRYPVIKEIRERFSPRFFSTDPVKEKDLNSIFEAARWTPSGHNHQPWYFYYVKKGTASYNKLFSTLYDYNQAWAKSAPALILACAITKNEKGENPFAFYDLGAAVISLILQAQSLGYYSRQMGMFNKEKVKQMFKLDKNYQPFIVIALGKIGNYKDASEDMIKMELDPRPRKKYIVKAI